MPNSVQVAAVYGRKLRRRGLPLDGLQLRHGIVQSVLAKSKRRKRRLVSRETICRKRESFAENTEEGRGRKVIVSFLP